MKISVKMSGKNWGDYHFGTEKMVLERLEGTDTVFITVVPLEKLMVESAKIILSLDEAFPLSRALQNLLEGRVESDELCFPKKV